jgi:hypothetical protein
MTAGRIRNWEVSQSLAKKEGSGKSKTSSQYRWSARKCIPVIECFEYDLDNNAIVSEATVAMCIVKNGRNYRWYKKRFELVLVDVRVAVVMLRDRDSKRMGRYNGRNPPGEI